MSHNSTLRALIRFGLVPSLPERRVPCICRRVVVDYGRDAALRLAAPRRTHRSVM